MNHDEFCPDCEDHMDECMCNEPDWCKECKTNLMEEDHKVDCLTGIDNRAADLADAMTTKHDE